MTSVVDVAFLTHEPPASPTRWPLLRQTEDGNGRHHGVQFHLDGRAEAQWLVVYYDLPMPVSTSVPWERRILVVTEPPSIQTYTSIHANQFGILISPVPIANYRGRWIRSQGGLQWFYGVAMGDGRPVLRHDFSALIDLPVPSPKSNRISIVTSNKTKVARHRERVALVSYLKEKFPDRFDVYGQGYQPVGDKADAIDGYRYHLVIENNNLPDFWTEKLADAYLGFALPLFSGCPNIADYFPSDSFVMLGNITDHAGIADRLIEILEADPWAARLDAIRKARNLLLQRHNIFSLVADVAINGANAPVSPLSTPATIQPFSGQFRGPLGRLRHFANRVQVLAARR
jgi:hypothetical protein